ncbi:MAG: alanine racemase [Saccharofermentanaceae bacterium]|nr:alanine racemase [Saccharofermentanaceae bacterium]
MTDEQILSFTKNAPTPLYVFDLGELEKRVAFLRSCLPEKVELCYAVKANTFIIEKAAEIVDLLEICSPGEYRICDRLSVPHSKFVVSGVNKQADFIDSAIASDEPAAYFTAESVNQFHMLRDSAEKHHKRISVLLRLTSGNQFGLDKDDLFDVIARYKDDPWVEITGIQYFSGTQKNSLKKLKRELDYVDTVLSELLEKHSYAASKLEYGTGFPVSYFDGENFDESAFLEEFSKLLSDMAFKGKITLEIGRSIAASCGTYLTRVVDTKVNCGERYAIVDGGMHQIVYYGQFMAMKHPKIRRIAAVAGAESGTAADWNICGSLCTINDFLVKKFPFTDLRIGDILLFPSAGAYCVTEGIALFLSRELPGVYLLDTDGSIRKVRDQIPTEKFNST